MTDKELEKRKARYEEIIDLPHPEPKTHPRMERAARAAQFAPFAALTGFEQKIARAVEEVNSSDT